jgi:hypothetical protein
METEMMNERIPAIQKLIRQLMTEHAIAVAAGEPVSDLQSDIYVELSLIDNRLTLIRSKMAQIEKELAA